MNLPCSCLSYSDVECEDVADPACSVCGGTGFPPTDADILRPALQEVTSLLHSLFLAGCIPSEKAIAVNAALVRAEKALQDTAE